MSGRCECLASQISLVTMHVAQFLTENSWTSPNFADEPSAEDATKIVWLGSTDKTEEVLEPDLLIIDVRNSSSLSYLHVRLCLRSANSRHGRAALHSHTTTCGTHVLRSPTPCAPSSTRQASPVRVVLTVLWVDLETRSILRTQRQDPEFRSGRSVTRWMISWQTCLAEVITS
jgi:hypothetical protein